MVLHKCTGCKTETSWRYHKPSATTATFFKKLCIAFDIHQSSFSEYNGVVLCHSCTGVIKRTEEFVKKLKQTNESDSADAHCTSFNVSNTGSTITSVAHNESTSSDNEGVFQTKAAVSEVKRSYESDSADAHCTTRNVSNTGSTITSVAHNESTSRDNEDDTQPKAAVSELKRLHDSDHCYHANTIGTTGNSFHGDHDYACNLFGEDEEVDGEEYDGNQKGNLEEIKRLLPKYQYSSTYDLTSVLKTTSLTAISEKNLLKEITIELSERCPDLLQTLVNVCIKDESSISMRHIASIVVAYSALMFARNNKNSAFQRCMTMLAVKGNANDEFIRRMNRLSLSLSCSGKLKILKKTATTSREMLVRTITSNPLCKVTGDNLDMYIVTNHQRIDSQNQDIHWFASNLTTARLDYTNVSNDIPNMSSEVGMFIDKSKSKDLEECKKDSVHTSNSVSKQDVVVGYHLNHEIKQASTDTLLTDKSTLYRTNDPKSEKNELHTCETYNKDFSTLEELRFHTRKHTGDYSCDICNKTFTSQHALKTHKDTHSGHRTHMCGICHKGFSLKKTLQEHIRTHTREKAFICEFCGRGFSHGSSLIKHKAIHSDDKPRTCLVCNRGFRRSDTLLEHSKIHTGEQTRKYVTKKEYNCSTCNKVFRKSSHLKVHARIHTGEKPFKCEICDKQFYTNYDLKKHINVHNK